MCKQLFIKWCLQSRWFKLKKKILILKQVNSQFLLILGNCVCDVGFYGFDCSLSLNETPLLSNTSYYQNVFDLSNGSLKDAVLFVIKFASDNQNAVLRIKLLVFYLTYFTGFNHFYLLIIFSRWQIVQTN
jgi:hypothetical protein